MKKVRKTQYGRLRRDLRLEIRWEVPSATKENLWVLLSSLKERIALVELVRLDRMIELEMVTDA